MVGPVAATHLPCNASVYIIWTYAKNTHTCQPYNACEQTMETDVVVSMNVMMNDDDDDAGRWQRPRHDDRLADELD